MKTWFDLHKGEENKEIVIRNVRNNISFTGSNLWILMSAVLIASVGLNLNSTAVVIGAMLISPLMGPILGVGFALGVFDFELLRRSLKNLLIATVASLFVSTIYFLVSPLKEAHSELLSRVSPNFYDVIIAFFGGIVGVIAITRLEKGNPIPGVAIATALMPPLCTAGYGLATGNFVFFFGALFLYTINCVFIGIATFLIVKYLKYPQVEFINKKEERRVHRFLTIVSAIILIPSVYFAYSLYKEQDYRNKVDQFLNKEVVEQGKVLVFKKINFNSNPKKIEIAILNNIYTKDEITILNQKLQEYQIPNTSLIIKQNSENSIISLKDNILNEIARNELSKSKIELAQNMFKSDFDNVQLLKEARIINPKINLLSVSNNTIAKNDTVLKRTILLYQSSKSLDSIEENKLKNWVEKRLNVKNVEVFK